MTPEGSNRTALVVRLAAPEDAAGLAALAARTFADAFAADNTPEDLAEHLAANFSPERQAAEIADPSTVMIVAETGGELVGYVMLRKGKAPPSVPGQQPIELARIYVLVEWQSRRVGGALMERCLAEASATGAGTIWLGVWQRNTRAQAFYERWGFKVAGTKSFIVGSDEQIDWVMTRDLAEQRRNQVASPMADV